MSMNDNIVSRLVIFHISDFKEKLIAIYRVSAYNLFKQNISIFYYF